MYIRVRKDPQQKWFNLPYLATNDGIQETIKPWLSNWHTPSDLAVGTSKSMEDEKKDTTTQKVQLAEKCRKEAEEKAGVEEEHTMWLEPCGFFYNVFTLFIKCNTMTKGL